MDSEFDKRWRAADPPFDGMTVFPDDFVPLAELSQMLVPVVELLYAHNPEAALFRLKDWHAHDGYVSEAVPAEWQELRSLLVSEDALLVASTDETDVSTAFFTEERDFLLRIYLPDIHDNASHERDIQFGIFDVTSQEPLALQVRDAILDARVVAVRTMPAKAFFDRNYAG